MRQAGVLSPSLPARLLEAWRGMLIWCGLARLV